ncbi:28 kDa ribonucleoprotein, chloroplastic [Punica granatum]|uniref:RRM domain-containing protein n=2 Tax=Punica granatum TaxID=22663 RepID=A0A218X8Y3_PUNGR|nr:28 kDa ribonucleoprotein, chloroplastic [Punica granatum]OWM80981.1 hypothetical protein CDL15_Pgr007012 [Punica granatum]PKI45580.1 hypothetical protein CRG98_033896 [Punica granatum]
MATLFRPIFFSSVPVEAFSSTPLTSSSQSLVYLPLSSPPFSCLSHTLNPRARRPTNPFSCSFSAVAVETSELELDAKQENSEEAEEVSKTRLIAQNVPWSCTAEDIRSLFEKHGTVVDVELSMYNKTRNRGLAFVEMASPEEALRALNNLESSEYEGRTLRLNYANPRKKKPSPPAQPRPIPTFNLFVANLSYEARAKDLREFFDSGSGTVASAEVIFHDNPRRSSGYGFVSFKYKKAAESAISAFQGKEFMGRPIRIARSKQFVKLQSKESLQSSETSAEVESIAEVADAAE